MQKWEASKEGGIHFESNILIDILNFRLGGYIAFMLKIEFISSAFVGYQLCAQSVQDTGTTVIK